MTINSLSHDTLHSTPGLFAGQNQAGINVRKTGTFRPDLEGVAVQSLTAFARVDLWFHGVRLKSHRTVL